MPAATGKADARFFRWAARLAAGLVIGAIVLLIALLALYGGADRGTALLLFGFFYVVLAVPICFASALLAGISISKGEPHRRGAIVILIVMGFITWTLKAAPFRLADSLIEGYLQRPWP
jgi:hypothetical protein